MNSSREVYLHCRLINTRLKSNPSYSSFIVAFYPTGVIQLSWKPRAFMYKGFLSEDECNHLIQLVKDMLGMSMVDNDKSDDSVAIDFRTSSSMFLRKAQVSIS